jgi:hypothetical protein
MHSPLFRDALLSVEPLARDAWVDTFLGLRELPDDGDDLPRDCVPYLPCPVDAIVRVVDEAQIGARDVFVDLGAGVGRAMAVVHLLTGAATIGVEIQRDLARASRELAGRIGGSGMSVIEGDATELVSQLTEATVFFLYCPFGRARVETTIDRIAPLARERTLRICTVDLPLPARAWLAPIGPAAEGVVVYRTITG